MKVAIYARVSTHDQDELLQVPRLEAYCERVGYQVVRKYTDEASGKAQIGPDGGLSYPTPVAEILRP